MASCSSSREHASVREPIAVLLKLDAEELLTVYRVVWLKLPFKLIS